MLLFILFVILWGLGVGALARLAVPGPDPMPVWATIALGLGGSVVGGVAVRIVFGGTGPGLVGSVLFAIALLIGYRRYVQKRAVWGPRAGRSRPGE